MKAGNPNFVKGHTPWNKGKPFPHSDEWREKMSLIMKGHKGYWEGKKRPKEFGEGQREFMKSQPAEFFRGCLKRRGMSGLEEKVNNLIIKNKLPYKFVGDGKFMIERKCPDFINTNGEKIAVEVYYKRHKEEIRNMTISNWKRQRSKLFAKYGWRIIYIEGSDFRNQRIINVLKGGD